ncbi:MAG: hypothetical protein EGR72_05100 [Clostridiales bacterium]|nr:hypothetical protein [Clostridiales bacterium]
MYLHLGQGVVIVPVAVGGQKDAGGVVSLQAVQQTGHRRDLSGVHRQGQDQQLLRAEGFLLLVRAGER